MFKQKLRTGFTAMALVALTAASFAENIPMMVTLVLDGTGSVSEPAFRDACQQSQTLVQALKIRAEATPGANADWLSIAWFGGQNTFQMTDYCNCSHTWKMNELGKQLRYKSHPKFGSTAVYSAALKSIVASAEFAETRPYEYFHVVIVVTDGTDNDSPLVHKQLFRELFPNDSSLLCIVGVGSQANVGEYNNDADLVQTVDSFEELSVALVLVMQYMSELLSSSNFNL